MAFELVGQMEVQWAIPNFQGWVMLMACWKVGLQEPWILAVDSQAKVVLVLELFQMALIEQQ